jgi:hypothetical protein
MKKLVFLPIMALALMSATTKSYTSNGETIFTIEESLIEVCCTATYYVDGEPQGSATQCLNGIGPETQALACRMAQQKVIKELGLEPPE